MSQVAAAVAAYPKMFKPDATCIGAELVDLIYDYLDLHPHIHALEVFFTVDTDGSGSVDREEWEQAVRIMRLDLTPEQLSSAFAHLDEDGGGTIEISEFVKQMMQAKKWRKRFNVQDLHASAESKQGVFVIHACVPLIFAAVA